jgi:predicted DNA-binding transcriptional regulator YafY
MDKFDRVFRLHSILASRRTAIPLEDLMAQLECSKSTLHRTINVLKDYLHAPIIFDPTYAGYRYAASKSQTFELPGLWFTPAELQALVVLQSLLNEIGGGLLEEFLGPVARRLQELTQHQRLHLGEAATRLRFPALAARPAGAAFQLAASATLQRKKVWMEYHARSTDEITERTVSPQRVTHYRESWYLDTWDETRAAFRSFAMEKIRRLVILEEPAIDLTEAELNEHFASAFGIFSGKADKIAVLLFSSERARWVADEQWVPNQEGRRLEDGRYELRIPYHDPRELVMEILRHGAHVCVLEPASLIEAVRSELHLALQQYGSDPMPSAG